MQIIVDDHTEIKYYRQCLEQINNKYSQNIVVDKCTVIDICDLCIETLVQDFIIFLDRYQNPQDLFQFILLYSNLATEKQRSENTFILMQMCRYVFMLIPKLKLSSHPNFIFFADLLPSTSGDFEYGYLVNNLPEYEKTTFIEDWTINDNRIIECLFERSDLQKSLIEENPVSSKAAQQIVSRIKSTPNFKDSELGQLLKMKYD